MRWPMGRSCLMPCTEVGVDRQTGSRWLDRYGGVRPRRGLNLRRREVGRVLRQPTLDPASAHLVLAPTRKTGTERLIGAVQPPNLLSF